MTACCCFWWDSMAQSMINGHVETMAKYRKSDVTKTEEQIELSKSPTAPQEQVISIQPNKYLNI